MDLCLVPTVSNLGYICDGFKLPPYRPSGSMYMHTHATTAHVQGKIPVCQVKEVKVT